MKINKEKEQRGRMGKLKLAKEKTSNPQGGKTASNEETGRGGGAKVEIALDLQREGGLFSRIVTERKKKGVTKGNGCSKEKGYEQKGEVQNEGEGGWSLSWNTTWRIKGLVGSQLIQKKKVLNQYANS